MTLTPEDIAVARRAVEGALADGFPLTLKTNYELGDALAKKLFDARSKNGYRNHEVHLTEGELRDLLCGCAELARIGHAPPVSAQSTEEVYVEVVRFSDNAVIERLGPHSQQRAAKIEDGINVNIDHELYGTRQVSAATSVVQGEKDVDRLAAHAHRAWVKFMLHSGITSRTSATGVETLVPYNELPEIEKEQPRTVVRAILDAIRLSS